MHVDMQCTSVIYPPDTAAGQDMIRVRLKPVDYCPCCNLQK